MKRMIVAAEKFYYKNCEIVDTGSGFKVYKDGQLVSEIEFASVDDAVAAINNLRSRAQIKQRPVSESRPIVNKDWLKEFSNYTSKMRTRIYPNGNQSDGVYALGDKVLMSYLKSFKKKYPDADLHISRIFKDGEWIYAVR